MLGIIIPMPTEARCFSPRLREMKKLYNVGQHALVVVSGMGEQVIQAAQTLYKAGASCLVSYGTAVGLTTHLRSGTVCIPQHIVNTEGTIYQNDPHLTSLFVEQRYQFKRGFTQGNLAHTADILTTQQSKEQLHQLTGSSAADMESFLIAHMSEQFNIRFFALRVIIDTVDFHFPSEIAQCISPSGKVSTRQLLSNICSHPGLLWPLGTLVRNYYHARNALRQSAKLKMLMPKCQLSD